MTQSAAAGIFAKSASSSRKRQVVIAGGGIAGLTAALALEQRGFAVTVFERAAELPSEGAGLQLSPNATRLLARLGVLQKLTACAVEVQSINLLSGAAKPLLSLDVTDSGRRWGAPYLAAHRADLAAALLHEAKARSAINIRFGAEVTHFAGHANGITASVTSDQGIGEVEGIFLVGADGARSRIGGELLNPAPKFTSYVAHRAMAVDRAALPQPLLHLLERRIVGAFLAPGAHLIAYPLRAGAELNLVCVTRSDAPPQQQGSQPGALISAPVAAQFAPEIAEFLNRRKWTQWPVYARQAAAKWSDGKNVMLIGDAAHAAVPFAAQGAAMAIEDAWTLANCLYANRDNLQRAPACYEQLRRTRIKRIAWRAALNGRAYHASGVAAAARNALFAFRGQKMLDGLDWIYGYDPGGQPDITTKAR